MQTSQKIDDQLIAILEGYKQRSLLNLSLRTYDKEDHGKDTEKGRSLASILAQMEAVELKILTSLAELLGVFERLCKEQNIASDRLDSIRLFKPHKVIEQALSSRTTLPLSFSELGCKTYNMLIQRPNQSNGSGKSSGLVATRHLVRFDEEVYDVVAIIESLIRMWSLMLESNLDCEEHAFVSRSRSVEVDMWVNGGFYEAATKLLPPAVTNKQAQIVSPELAVVKQDLQDRLKRIEFYYHERYETRDAIQKLCGRDVKERTKEHQHAVMKAQSAENNLLGELYHLGDDVRKYLKICSRSNDIKIVENFRPYHWCGNYVNHLKHGSRGKSRPPAIPGYQIEYYDQKGPKPTVEDKVVGCAFLINIDGRLEDGMEIAYRLIDMWFLFFRYHSDIELTDITARVNGIRRNEFIGKSIYSAKIPDGILDDAKRQAQERRKLNL